jgi:anaerobic magnesium-protoporphyrin IX monomethyl ester cyclase
MSILLINPPTFKENEPSIPPLGLAYIAAVLREHRFAVNIIDFDLERDRLGALEQIVDAFQPSLVGISALTLQLENAFSISRRIKSKLPDIISVIGGPHPSSLPELTLKQSEGSIDIVVVGEGEFTMLDIAQRKPLESIDGIHYWVKGGIASTPPRKPISNLNDLPLPTRDLLPIERYRGWGPINKYPSSHLIASRGCPYDCIFCSEKSVFGRAHRRRNPKKIVDEMEEMIQRYDLKEIAFYDDLFTLSKNQVLSICEEITRRGIRIQWKTLSRVDVVDLEMLQAMKAAGCWLISYGFESGSQAILDNIRKRQTLEQCLTAAALTRKAGIKLFGFFMIGNVGETQETIRKTIRFARRLKPDFFQFTVVRPDPGSYLFNQNFDNIMGRGLSWNEYYAFPEDNTAMPIVGTDIPLSELNDYRKLAYMYMSKKKAVAGMVKALMARDFRMFFKSLDIIIHPDNLKL